MLDVCGKGLCCSAMPMWRDGIAEGQNARQNEKSKGNNAQQKEKSKGNNEWQDLHQPQLLRPLVLPQ